MRLFKRTALAAALMPLVSPTAWSLGLGDIAMRSYLNEPLRAEVNLLDVKNLSADDIRIRLATQEDFDRLGVERAYFLTSIDFEVVVDGEDSKIVLSTDEPLLEPYLDILIETRWPSGRLLREYTVLVDLPPRIEPLPSTAQTTEPATSVSETREAAAPEAMAESAPVAPARTYTRDTRERPEAGSRYLVQANDTLWDIASKVRPEGASVEQTMIATVEMNSRAFTGGNINGLKAGYVLELPTESEILNSRSQANDMVAQHNSDWRAGIRRAPALRVVADNEFETDDEAPAVEPAPVAASTETEGASSEESAADVAEAPALSPVEPESVGVSNAELADIQQRLGQLSEQVTSLRQLVTVKDQQIAALQAQLAEREQQAAPAPAVTPAPAPAPASAMSMPWWVYALGGAVVLGLVGVLVARRRNTAAVVQPAAPVVASEIESVTAASAPIAQSNTPAASATPASTTAKASAAAPSASSAASASAETLSDDGERGYGRKLHNDYAEENATSDAIAEAEIYVAYGRYQQALNLLATAAKTDTSNPAAYLKMLEIYLKNDRREEAEALIPKIEQTHDLDAVKQAVAMLGEPVARADAIDLGELGDSPTQTEATKASMATMATMESGTESDELAPMEFDLVPNTPAAAEPPSLELDLDLPGDDASSAADSRADGADQSDLELPDWGDLSDTVEEDNDRLPPELAAVLGTDVPPPAPDDFDSSDEDKLIYATEADPMETKLDLARAYIDMGDEDGARPVLEEVIARGDLQQQAEARELLIRLD